MVGQLAKRAGLRVIGIAGSDQKCEVAVNEFGFDYCINHRNFATAKALRTELAEHAPETFVTFTKVLT